MKMEYLTKVAPIINESVKPYKGERFFLKTGNLIFDKIAELEAHTFKKKPSRANQNVKVEDLILAKMKGTVKVLKIDKINSDIMVSTGFFVLRPSKKINPLYLEYILKSSEFQKSKDKLAKGATQKAINNTNLKKIKIPLPPIDIQMKIAEALDKAQELIDNRKEQIAKYDKLIQSLFFDMFGDPVTNSKGWEKKNIKDIVKKIDSGWSPKCYNKVADSNKWGVLRLSAVTGGEYSQKENKELPDEVEPKVEKEVKVYDLLMARKNTPELVGDCTYVFETREKLIMSDLIFRLDTKDNVDRKFLWKLLMDKKFKSKVKSLAGGSAKSMSNISKAKLMDLVIPFPPLSIQRQFGSIVEKIEHEKKRLEASLNKMENNFNSLMKKSFKGDLF